jgi:NADPH2:quinone reductase
VRAVQVTRLDGPDALEVGQVADLQPADDQLLIEVHVAGVTFPDVLLTRGEYQMKPGLPFIPGSEVAGIVRGAPEGSPVQEGDRVVAFPGLGGFAERVVADPRVVFPLPERMSFEAGAALPMNYLTVHFALRRRGGLQPGETLLVHGAAGGVGTAGVQLARAMGARVIAVVSTEAKGEMARKAGATDVVLADGFRDAVKELTGGRGVDVVLDPVGGDRFTDSLRSLAPEGRLLVVGFTGGEIPTVKVNRLLLNNISVVGVGWGAFWLPRVEYLQEQWTELVPHLESGAIDPPLGSSYPLAQAGAAVRELDQRQATGKVVLTLR